MRYVGLLLVVGVLARSAGAEDEPPALASFTSVHYELSTNESEAFARDALAALEAAWPQMEAFFGARPKLKKDERLRIRHTVTRTQWEEVMRDEGIRPPVAGGGYYAPANRTAYVYRQPTVYNTRQLLLHEAMHQFHFLARSNNVGPKDTWYTEGLVEHLSRHTWDGATLRLGVVPTISLADYPTKALKAFTAPDFDVAQLVASKRPFSREEAWALVRFLATSERVSPKRWKKLRGQLDGGRTAAKVFKGSIGAPKKLLPEIIAWLKTQQEPLRWIWNEWQGLGPRTIQGWAKVTSAVHLRADATSIQCSIQPPNQVPWKAGLLLHYTTTRDYTVALVKSGGLWTVNRRVGDRWQVLASGALKSPLPAPFVVRAVRGKDGAVAFLVEGTQVASLPTPPGKMGFALENCRATFTDLGWE